MRAVIQRSQVFPFIWTSTTSVSWSVALDIGYDPAVSPRRISTITANGVIELPLITVDALQVEGLRSKKIHVTCQDIPELAGVEGLLGLSFLKHFRTVIDYKSGFGVEREPKLKKRFDKLSGQLLQLSREKI